MKYLPLVLFIASAILWALNYRNPGNGYGWVAGITAAIGVGIVLVNLARTGKAFTDEAGGH